MSGCYPLARAWQANRRTTLRHALAWAAVAWLAWVAAAWGRVLRPEEAARLGAYAALCLTGCAGIAVLGARRPGAAAWNFVVGGLLAVLLLPVVNGWGEVRLEAAQVFFLAVALGVPAVNYLPTRAGWAALLLAPGCALELTRLVQGEALPSELRSAGLGLIALSPWAAWAMLRRRPATLLAFDRLWLSQRDRFGFVWAQRIREQFNRAAAHAGWHAELRWRGLYAPTDSLLPDGELLALLRAVCQRFTTLVDQNK